MTYPNETPATQKDLALLRTTDLFKQIPENLLKDLSSHLTKVSLEAGEKLYSQGDPGDALFVVKSGQLQVVSNNADGTEKVLGKIKEGQMLGEVQLFTGGIRTAGIVAAGAAELLKLAKAGFEELLKASPEVSEKITQIVQQRLRRDELMSILPKFFWELPKELAQEVEREMEWVQLKSGETLFRKGDPADSMYIIISGRLQVVVEEGSNRKKITSEMVRGEIIGEISLLNNENRTADIFAIRDSELVKLTRPAFEKLAEKEPQVMKAIANILVKRIRSKEREIDPDDDQMNIAIVPLSDDVPVAEFAERFADAISVFGLTLHLSKERLSGLSGGSWEDVTEMDESHPDNVRLTVWLEEQEARHRFSIYELNSGISAWTRRCLGRADIILFLANANGDHRITPIEEMYLTENKQFEKTRKNLVLIHPDKSGVPKNTIRWFEGRQLDDHVHIPWNSPSDFYRLARLISGYSIGLVLSGGGARGYVHIGALKALNENNLAIDVVGGTSAGAGVAAMLAMGMTPDEMLETSKAAMTKHNPFKRFSIPIMSFFPQSKIDYVTKLLYGESQIEDLWMKYFCISSNLTTAEEVVHSRGSLWKAVRASTSLPGVLVPVIDNYELLVDGGIIDNIPISTMKQFSRGKIIAVNVSPEEDLEINFTYEELPSSREIFFSRINPFKQSIKVPKLGDILIRSIVVNSINRLRKYGQEADLYLEPPVDKFGILEFEAIDEMVQLGYDYAKEKIKAWNPR